jgi:hypothetical protein
MTVHITFEFLRSTNEIIVQAFKSEVMRKKFGPYMDEVRKLVCYDE